MRSTSAFGWRVPLFVMVGMALYTMRPTESFVLQPRVGIFGRGCTKLFENPERISTRNKCKLSIKALQDGSQSTGNVAVQEEPAKLATPLPASRDDTAKPTMKGGTHTLKFKGATTSVHAPPLDVILPPGMDDSVDLGCLRFTYPQDLEIKPCKAADATKPLLLFVPGIDGLGLFAEAQYEDLSRSFELRVLQIPGEDRLDFHGLVAAVEAFLSAWKAASPSKDKPMLLGESAGALISLGVALKNPNVVHSVTLANPATSYLNTIWPVVGNILTTVPDVVPLGNATIPSIFRRLNVDSFADRLGLMPDRSLGDIAFAGAAAPIMALAALDQYQLQKFARMAAGTAGDFLQSVPKGTAPQRTAELAKDAVDALQFLFETMPPAVVKHRLANVLKTGSEYLEPRLSQVSVPVLVMAGEDDRTLPSGKEARRLEKIIPKCSRIVTGGGHLLLDERVNVTKIMLKSPVAPLSFKKDPVTGFVPPSRQALENATESLNLLRRLASPVFLSTDPETRQVDIGLQRLKAALSKGPVLVVGNHQLLALDLGLLIDGVYKETGILLRGLAHPMLFAQGMNAIPGMISGGQDSENMYEAFGAVPVSPRNFHKMLSRGDPVLLFPGGMGEALHGKNELYKLKWPEKTDFVRLAARFNATIIPFGGVGASESASVVADPDEVQSFTKTPLGAILARLSLSPPESQKNKAYKVTMTANHTQNKFGVEGLNADRLSMAGTVPIFAPKAPWELSRFYFLFGVPISTENVDVDNAEQCAEVYEKSKAGVNECIEYLLDQRIRDPYKEIGARVLYETRFARQAPTFDPTPLHK